jgi:hypothetical protein
MSYVTHCTSALAQVRGSTSVGAWAIWSYALSGRLAVEVPGLLLAGPELLAAELGLPKAVIVEGLEALQQRGLAHWDRQHDLLQFPSIPLLVPPPPGNVLEGWWRRWRSLPNCSLKFSYLDILRGSVNFSDPARAAIWEKFAGAKVDYSATGTAPAQEYLFSAHIPRKEYYARTNGSQPFPTTWSGNGSGSGSRSSSGETSSDVCQITPPVGGDPVRLAANKRPPSGGSRKKKANGEQVAFDFDGLYAVYPRKEGKTRGIATCAKVITTPEIYAQVRAAIVAYKGRVAGEPTKFIKLFSTFMNCWQDYAPGNGVPPPALDPLEMKL